MSVKNELNSSIYFDLLLVESEQEETEDAEDSVGSIVLPASSCDDESDSDSESEDVNDEGDVNDQWSDNVIPHKPWIFADNQSGVNKKLLLGCTEPVHFYELFMGSVWDLIVKETNRYGQEKDESWIPTTTVEMKKFIGLCFQMGIVRLPRLRDYWSSSPAFGCNPIGSQSMPRNRFENLLTHLHLADNASYNGKDRLYKITPLIEIINRACERICKPGRDIYIDQSIVPLRDGNTFCEDVADKKQKFGIRLFKLCTKEGYTCRIVVHAGKETSRDCSMAELVAKQLMDGLVDERWQLYTANCYTSVSVTESVVKRLMEGLLDEGRHLYTDNWCTSVSLAKSLLERKTYLTGKCKKNQKRLPKLFIEQKLKRGQMKAQQNQNGVVVLKWKDKNDIIVVSTTSDATAFVDSTPKVIKDYNEAKLLVDAKSQRACYSPFIRKGRKWYIRIFFHLITQTCLINAWKLYCDNVQKVTVDDFKIQVYLSLLQIGSLEIGTPLSEHILEDTSPIAKIRRRCIGCYKKLAEFHDSKTAAKRAKQITTRCTQCGKHFCLDCFNNSHRMQV